MALENLEIQIEDTDGTPNSFKPYFKVQFNPRQLSFSTRSRWQPAPAQGREHPDKQFTGGEGATLSLELFFDSYEQGGSVGDWIGPLRALTEIVPKIARPPKCLLFWGSFGASQGRLFTGVLESLQETYTLFLADGTPVRATVQCSFSELRDKKEEPAARQPAAETSTLTANASDTLSSLAAKRYGDPAAWRQIAEANGIDDPSEIPAGKALVIPPIAGGLF